MATDVSAVHKLGEELRRTHDIYRSLVDNSATGIVAVDDQSNVRIMNPAAQALLNCSAACLPSAEQLRAMLPERFFNGEVDGVTPLNIDEIAVRTADNQEVPVRFSAVPLRSHGRRLGRAAFLQDLREIKKLEQERLEAERLAAVGQTVAGLAHSIKNLLMGLEGGMYMVDSGLRRADAARIAEGWNILHRNFEKTTNLVKDFLSFAKGRLPELRPADPNAVARGVVELYQDAAARQGVKLLLEAGSDVCGAPLNVNGIETCLTNLVSNAIDAAILREQGGGTVIVRTREENSDLVFEVSDNGSGMDQEITAKLFTTFFTTKGGQGTGLGLLTTRKIVQEHGGRVEMESVAGQGSVFRIRLPRKRLETLAAVSTRNAPAEQVKS